MKAFKTFIKYVLSMILAVAVIGMLALAAYYGQDIAHFFGFYDEPVAAETPETPRVVREVVIKSEFEELKRAYMESKEGAQVLDTWATQKALSDMREKLDEVESTMLEKEASL